MIDSPIAKHLRYVARRVERKGPSFLFYYLTLRCNSKCSYCHVPDMPDPSDAEFADVIDNLRCAAKMGITHIILTGGEPLLYSDLKPVLEDAKRLGFHVTLTTNGLNYAEHARDILGLVDNLEFSLSATDSESYSMERGVNGYGKVIDAIRFSLDLGERPVISATITEHNLAEIPALITFTQRSGLMLLLKPAFEYFGNGALDTRGACDFRLFRKTRNVWYNDAFVDFFISGGNQIEAPRCRALASTIAISPGNGLYLPCFHHTQEELPIDGSLEESMRSSKMQAYKRKRGSWEFCKGCRIICYFEDAFLWPPGRFLVKDILSRIRWLYRWQRYH